MLQKHGFQPVNQIQVLNKLVRNKSGVGHRKTSKFLEVFPFAAFLFLANFIGQMFFVYILYSASFDKYYVGQTRNLEDRIIRHNKYDFCFDYPA